MVVMEMYDYVIMDTDITRKTTKTYEFFRILRTGTTFIVKNYIFNIFFITAKNKVWSVPKTIKRKKI